MQYVQECPGGWKIPSRDAIKLYVQLEEEDVHFVDSIFKGYPGIANVRREYIIRNGRKYFLIYVPPDFLTEVKSVLDRLGKFIKIGELYIDEGKKASE